MSATLPTTPNFPDKLREPSVLLLNIMPSYTVSVHFHARPVHRDNATGIVLGGHFSKFLVNFDFVQSSFCRTHLRHRRILARQILRFSALSNYLEQTRLSCIVCHSTPQLSYSSCVCPIVHWCAPRVAHQQGRSHTRLTNTRGTQSAIKRQPEAHDVRGKSVLLRRSNGNYQHLQHSATTASLKSVK